MESTTAVSRVGSKCRSFGRRDSRILCEDNRKRRSHDPDMTPDRSDSAGTVGARRQQQSSACSTEGKRLGNSSGRRTRKHKHTSTDSHTFTHTFTHTNTHIHTYTHAYTLAHTSITLRGWLGILTAGTFLVHHNSGEILLENTQNSRFLLGSMVACNSLWKQSCATKCENHFEDVHLRSP